MKIVKLKAVNIKKIKTAEITPEGNLVFISGKNGQGKSSIMDCILYALGGEKQIPSQPVRNGEKEAEIEIDLGDFIVKRTFNEAGNSYLTVKTKDGATFPKAQEKLNNLVNTLYFDPLKFTNMSAKEQKELLMKTLKIDLTQEEYNYRTKYEERTTIGAMGKTAKGELDSIAKPEAEYFKKEEIKIGDTMVEIKNLEETREIILENKDRKSGNETEIKRHEEEINALKASNLILKEKIEKLEKDNPKIEEKIIEKQKIIDSADDTNAKIREAKRYTEAEARVNKYTEDWKTATKKLEEITESKNKKLQEAKMPIENLSVDENGVTYNGLPFEQLAKSEQIRISTAIAMSNESELKMIRIMDGSLLDKDAIAKLGEMAEAKDYQIWIEIVDDSGEVGFYIEDGEIKKQN